MVVLVSFQFHSISAFEVWTFGLLECTFLLGIPFGHSLGIFEQINAHYLGCWFFGRRGNHAKARAASGVGQEIVVQSQAGTSSFSS